MIYFLSFPHSLISLVCFLILPSHVVADPATVPFQNCFDPGSNISHWRFNVSTVYAQVLQNEVWGHYLNLTVLGESPEDILGRTNTSSSLATLFTTTSVLTLNAWSNSSYLCQNLRPPSPLPAMDPNENTFCPISAGPFAMSSTIPWGANRELTTLNTRLRAVDPFGQELVCLDVFTTPLAPHPHSPYGRAKIILWSTVALAIAYWFVIGTARIVSAWNRGTSRPGRGLWGRAQSAGFILASAISGERLAASPALMRFSTPCLRDVIFHTQWCAILAMVAVQWPQFVYPLLTQAAWSTLSYNISLTEGSKLHHWNPLATIPFSPPANFSAQLADSNSPLYIDPTVPNVLFTLPENATDGMFSFAYTLGLRPQDLFPTCLILFLSIIGVTMTLSILVWFIDLLVSLIPGAVVGSVHGSNSLSRFAGSRSPVFGARERAGSPPVTAEERSFTALSDKQLHNRFGLPLSSSSSGPVERGINSHRAWWRFRSDTGTFHTNVLHGNLVRILVLFHLPVTIFSCYQMTLPRSQASLSSITLAALSFIFISILIPLHLVVRVKSTKTEKLYGETWTLLSLGPLYNHYRHGSQLFACLLFATNIAFGVTIGVGQKSGTAQAIVILVVEVVSALVTSIWLPWGSGASMGLISFLFCVARIVVAVLLVILAPTISIGPGPGGWVAYGILIILALVYLALVLMLLVKIIEAIVRIVGGIGFDRSKHVVDSGLIGACSLLGCCGGPKRRRRPKGKNTRTTDLQQPTTRRNSDLSSYNPPIPMALGNDSVTTAPKFLGTESRKDSSGSHPPSVLKPEHANRPYKEDTDDEGFIMGAWQPYPPTGYISMTDGPQTSAPDSIHSPTLPKATSSTPTSGFSRVGGGRANMDTPYAINTGTGSTQTFPSIGQQSTTMLVPPVFPDDDDPPLPLTSLRQPEQGLLAPGGIQPVHIRTKSQTAIIEDAGWVYPAGAGAIASGSSPLRSQFQLQQAAETLLRPLPPSRFTLNVPDDDDDSIEDHQHKKRWYNFRKSRPHSSEGRTSMAAPSASASTAQVDGELGGAGDTPSPQRSFVVIRKPPGSMGRLNQAIAAASAAADNATTSVPLARPPTR